MTVEPTIREQISRALVKLEGSVHTYGKAYSVGDYVDRLAPFAVYGLRAIEAWPDHGKDWPSAKELTELAERLTQRAKIEAASRMGVGGTPVAQFIAAVLRSERGGPGYVRSWIDASAYPMIEAGTIRTTKLGAERLELNFGELAKSLNVRIVYDRTVDHRLSSFVADLRAEGKLENAPRRKAFAA